MPTFPNFCVIYNRSAGRSKSTKKWRAIQELLGKDAVYRPTDRARHGNELAQQAIDEGFRIIVAAGGDGTVHEVMNGVVSAKCPDAAFGVLPLGSGNDYARMIGVPFDPPGMVQRLRSTERWAVDVGEVTLDGTLHEYVCNTIGIGIGGAVTWEAKKIRWLRGIPLYGLAAMKSIWKHLRTVPIRLTEDGIEKTTTLLYAVVAIGKEEGGGFVVAPDAKLDDGVFELLYVPKLSRLGAMIYLPRMALGWLPVNCEVIQRRQVHELTIESELPLPVHADGEILATPQAGIRHCVIKVLPRRLTLCGRPLVSNHHAPP